MSVTFSSSVLHRLYLYHHSSSFREWRSPRKLGNKKYSSVWVMQLASWLGAGPYCVPILPTPLCQGGARNRVSPETSLRPNQLVLEDSMWGAMGCNSVVHSPLFSVMIIVWLPISCTVLGSQHCAQCLGNPHNSQLRFGPPPEILLDVHQSQESPWR